MPDRVTDLIERDAQLAHLRACAEASADGGRVVLVLGEAGIGKTSLVRAFVASLGGTPAWWGACDALLTPQPLAPLHDIARSAEVSFGALLAQPAAGHALFAAVLRDLELAGPIAMIVEDAHWADQSTLDLLRFLGRRIDRTRATLVVTFRDDEVSASHALRAVIGDLPAASTSRLDLPRLTEHGVATLARRALRSPTGLHAASGGNPFFVSELLRSGVANLPRSVQDLVLGRYARLPPRAQEIVQLAATVPARIERWLVQALLDPTPAEIEACLDSGLLQMDEAAYFFRHELARASIEQATSCVASEALHGRVLKALVERGGARPARLAHHAVRAVDGEAILRYAPLAAREASERGARREAAAQYRAALAAAKGFHGADRLALLDAYAMECRVTHQLAEAIAAREEIGALLASDGGEEAQARNASQLAIDYVAALRNADADHSSLRAIALLQGLPPGRALAQAYRVEAQLRMLNRDLAEAVSWGEKAIALAERLDDVEVLAAAHGTVGAALMFSDYRAGVARLEHALELALEHKLDYIAANSYVNLGSAAGEVFHLADAARWLQQAIAFSTEKEVDFYRTYALAWLGLVDFYCGRWDDAEAHAREALQAADESSTARVMALVCLGRLATRRGTEGADAWLDEALILAMRSGTLQRIAPVAAARAEAAMLRGDLPAVVLETRAVMEMARRHRHAWHVGELSNWLHCAGEEPAPLSECTEPHARQLAGDFAGAARAWTELGCPYEAARALSLGDAPAQLEALPAFEKLGARPVAEYLRRCLREAGVKGVPRGPRASTQSNRRGLTARELEILQLVCEGLRNSEIAERLFRSVRTVEHHVDAILGKLGARSRAEVAAIARREKLLPGKLGTATAKSR